MAARLGIGWKAGFWIAAAAVMFSILWLFNAVLLPFVMALVVGYLLDPLTNKLVKVGLGRASAVSVILIATLITVVVVLTVFAPMLVRQVSDFVKALPNLVQRAQDLAASVGQQLSHGWGAVVLSKLGIGGSSAADFKGYASDFVNKGVAWSVTVANGLLSRGAALLDLFSLLIITPVVGFYMLLDWPKMVDTIDGLVPPRNRDTVRAVAHDIDLALAGFLRGQSLVCLFLAVWYGIGLSLIGLNFGLLIGIIGGVLSFVPYVGSLVVLVLALLVAGGARLAELAPAGVRPRDRPDRSVPRGQRALAQARRRQGRPSSRVDHLRSARLWQRLGLHRPDRRRAGRGGDRCAAAVRHAALPREPDLHGRARAVAGRPHASNAVGPPFGVLMPDQNEDRARQLTLDLGREPSYSPDEFLVSPSNAQAHAMIVQWPNWPARTLLVTGPAGSGKSHLGAMWSARAWATTIRADDLSAPGRLLAAREAAPIVLLEDCDRAVHEEAVLFHLLNAVEEAHGWMMVTARRPADLWGIATPDLLSRMRRAPSVTIEAPDTALIKAVLVKLFADRQIRIDGDVVSYAARHCERSLEAISAFVAAVDEEGLTSGRRITRPLAARTLARLESEGGPSAI